MNATDDKYALVANQLAEFKLRVEAELNRQLFSPESFGPVPPLTWRDRLRSRVHRVQRYVSTLWDALRGREPYDVEYDA